MKDNPTTYIKAEFGMIVKRQDLGQNSRMSYALALPFSTSTEPFPAEKAAVHNIRDQSTLQVNPFLFLCFSSAVVFFW